MPRGKISSSEEKKLDNGQVRGKKSFYPSMQRGERGRQRNKSGTYVQHSNRVFKVILSITK